MIIGVAIAAFVVTTGSLWVLQPSTDVGLLADSNVLDFNVSDVNISDFNGLQVFEDSCDVPSDCNALTHINCEGEWFCTGNCEWKCDAPIEESKCKNLLTEVQLPYVPMVGEGLCFIEDATFGFLGFLGLSIENIAHIFFLTTLLLFITLLLWHFTNIGTSKMAWFIILGFLAIFILLVLKVI